MTNEMIILNARLQLMDERKIQGTGRTIEIEFEDGVHTLEEPQQIHTFAAWKALGYKVKKGSKAIVQLQIWKHKAGSKEVTARNENGEEVTTMVDNSKMFMKVASFFSETQVERMVTA